MVLPTTARVIITLICLSGGYGLRCRSGFSSTIYNIPIGRWEESMTCSPSSRQSCFIGQTTYNLTSTDDDTLLLYGGCISRAYESYFGCNQLYEKDIGMNRLLALIPDLESQFRASVDEFAENMARDVEAYLNNMNTSGDTEITYTLLKAMEVPVPSNVRPILRKLDSLMVAFLFDRPRINNAVEELFASFNSTKTSRLTTSRLLRQILGELDIPLPTMLDPMVDNLPGFLLQFLRNDDYEGILNSDLIHAVLNFNMSLPENSLRSFTDALSEMIPQEYNLSPLIDSVPTMVTEMLNENMQYLQTWQFDILKAYSKITPETEEFTNATLRLLGRLGYKERIPGEMLALITYDPGMLYYWFPDRSSEVDHLLRNISKIIDEINPNEILNTSNPVDAFRGNLKPLISMMPSEYSALLPLLLSLPELLEHIKNDRINSVVEWELGLLKNYSKVTPATEALSGSTLSLLRRFGFEGNFSAEMHTMIKYQPGVFYTFLPYQSEELDSIFYNISGTLDEIKPDGGDVMKLLDQYARFQSFDQKNQMITLADSLLRASISGNMTNAWEILFDALPAFTPVTDGTKRLSNSFFKIAMRFNTTTMAKNTELLIKHLPGLLISFLPSEMNAINAVYLNISDELDAVEFYQSDYASVIKKTIEKLSIANVQLPQQVILFTEELPNLFNAIERGDRVGVLKFIGNTTKSLAITTNESTRMSSSIIRMANRMNITTTDAVTDIIQNFPGLLIMTFPNDVSVMNALFENISRYIDETDQHDTNHVSILNETTLQQFAMPPELKNLIQRFSRMVDAVILGNSSVINTFMFDALEMIGRDTPESVLLGRSILGLTERLNGTFGQSTKNLIKFLPGMMITAFPNERDLINALYSNVSQGLAMQAYTDYAMSLNSTIQQLAVNGISIPPQMARILLQFPKLINALQSGDDATISSWILDALEVISPRDRNASFTLVPANGGFVQEMADSPVAQTLKAVYDAMQPVVLRDYSDFLPLLNSLVNLTEHLPRNDMDYLMNWEKDLFAKYGKETPATEAFVASMIELIEKFGLKSNLTEDMMNIMRHETGLLYLYSPNNTMDIDFLLYNLSKFLYSFDPYMGIDLAGITQTYKLGGFPGKDQVTSIIESAFRASFSGNATLLMHTLNEVLKNFSRDSKESLAFSNSITELAFESRIKLDKEMENMILHLPGVLVAAFPNNTNTINALLANLSFAIENAKVDDPNSIEELTRAISRMTSSTTLPSQTKKIFRHLPNFVNGFVSNNMTQIAHCSFELMQSIFPNDTASSIEISGLIGNYMAQDSVNGMDYSMQQLLKIAAKMPYALFPGNMHEIDMMYSNFTHLFTSDASVLLSSYFPGSKISLLNFTLLDVVYNMSRSVDGSPYGAMNTLLGLLPPEMINATLPLPPWFENLLTGDSGSDLEALAKMELQFIKKYSRITPATKVFVRSTLELLKKFGIEMNLTETMRTVLEYQTGFIYTYLLDKETEVDYLLHNVSDILDMIDPTEVLTHSGQQNQDEFAQFTMEILKSVAHFARAASVNDQSGFEMFLESLLSENFIAQFWNSKKTEPIQILNVVHNAMLPIISLYNDDWLPLVDSLMNITEHLLLEDGKDYIMSWEKDLFDRYGKVTPATEAYVDSIIRLFERFGLELNLTEDMITMVRHEPGFLYIYFPNNTMDIDSLFYNLSRILDSFNPYTGIEIGDILETYKLDDFTGKEQVISLIESAFRASIAGNATLLMHTLNEIMSTFSHDNNASLDFGSSIKELAIKSRITLDKNMEEMILHLPGVLIAAFPNNTDMINALLANISVEIETVNVDDPNSIEELNRTINRMISSSMLPSQTKNIFRHLPNFIAGFVANNVTLIARCSFELMQSIFPNDTNASTDISSLIGSYMPHDGVNGMDYSMRQLLKIAANMPYALFPGNMHEIDMMYSNFTYILTGDASTLLSPYIPGRNLPLLNFTLLDVAYNLSSLDDESPFQRIHTLLGLLPPEMINVTLPLLSGFEDLLAGRSGSDLETLAKMELNFVKQYSRITPATKVFVKSTLELLKKFGIEMNLTETMMTVLEYQTGFIYTYLLDKETEVDYLLYNVSDILDMIDPNEVLTPSEDQNLGASFAKFTMEILRSVARLASATSANDRSTLEIFLNSLSKETFTTSESAVLALLSNYNKNKSIQILNVFYDALRPIISLNNDDSLPFMEGLVNLTERLLQNDINSSTTWEKDLFFSYGKMTPATESYVDSMIKLIERFGLKSNLTRDTITMMRHGPGLLYSFSPNNTMKFDFLFYNLSRILDSFDPDTGIDIGEVLETPELIDFPGKEQVISLIESAFRATFAGNSTSLIHTLNGVMSNFSRDTKESLDFSNSIKELAMESGVTLGKDMEDMILHLPGVLIAAFPNNTGMINALLANLSAEIETVNADDPNSMEELNRAINRMTASSMLPSQTKKIFRHLPNFVEGFVANNMTQIAHCAFELMQSIIPNDTNSSTEISSLFGSYMSQNGVNGIDYSMQQLLKIAAKIPYALFPGNVHEINVIYSNFTYLFTGDASMLLSSYFPGRNLTWLNFTLLDVVYNMSSSDDESPFRRIHTLLRLLPPDMVNVTLPLLSGFEDFLTGHSGSDLEALAKMELNFVKQYSRITPATKVFIKSTLELLKKFGIEMNLTETMMTVLEYQTGFIYTYLFDKDTEVDYLLYNVSDILNMIDPNEVLTPSGDQNLDASAQFSMEMLKSVARLASATSTNDQSGIGIFLNSLLKENFTAPESAVLALLSDYNKKDPIQLLNVVYGAMRPIISLNKDDWLPLMDSLVNLTDHILKNDIDSMMTWGKDLSLRHGKVTTATEAYLSSIIQLIERFGLKLNLTGDMMTMMRHEPGLLYLYFPNNTVEIDDLFHNLSRILDSFDPYTGIDIGEILEMYELEDFPEKEQVIPLIESAFRASIAGNATLMMHTLNEVMGNFSHDSKESLDFSSSIADLAIKSEITLDKEMEDLIVQVPKVLIVAFPNSTDMLNAILANLSAGIKNVKVDDPNSIQDLNRAINQMSTTLSPQLKKFLHWLPKVVNGLVGNNMTQVWQGSFELMQSMTPNQTQASAEIGKLIGYYLPQNRTNEMDYLMQQLLEIAVKMPYALYPGNIHGINMMYSNITNFFTGDASMLLSSYFPGRNFPLLNSTLLDVTYNMSRSDDDSPFEAMRLLLGLLPPEMMNGSTLPLLSRLEEFFSEQSINDLEKFTKWELNFMKRYSQITPTTKVFVNSVLNLLDRFDVGLNETEDMITVLEYQTGSVYTYLPGRDTEVNALLHNISEVLDMVDPDKIENFKYFLTSLLLKPSDNQEEFAKIFSESLKNAGHTTKESIEVGNALVDLVQRFDVNLDQDTQDILSIIPGMLTTGTSNYTDSIGVVLRNVSHMIMNFDSTDPAATLNATLQQLLNEQQDLPSSVSMFIKRIPFLVNMLQKNDSEQVMTWISRTLLTTGLQNEESSKLLGESIQRLVVNITGAPLNPWLRLSIENFMKATYTIFPESSTSSDMLYRDINGVLEKENLKLFKVLMNYLVDEKTANVDNSSLLEVLSQMNTSSGMKSTSYVLDMVKQMIPEKYNITFPMINSIPELLEQIMMNDTGNISKWQLTLLQKYIMNTPATENFSNIAVETFRRFLPNEKVPDEMKTLIEYQAGLIYTMFSNDSVAENSFNDAAKLLSLVYPIKGFDLKELLRMSDLDVNFPEMDQVTSMLEEVLNAAISNDDPSDALESVLETLRNFSAPTTSSLAFGESVRRLMKSFNISLSQEAEEVILNTPRVVLAFFPNRSRDIDPIFNKISDEIDNFDVNYPAATNSNATVKKSIAEVGFFSLLLKLSVAIAENDSTTFRNNLNEIIPLSVSNASNALTEGVKSLARRLHVHDPFIDIAAEYLPRLGSMLFWSNQSYVDNIYAKASKALFETNLTRFYSDISMDIFTAIYPSQIPPKWLPIVKGREELIGAIIANEPNKIIRWMKSMQLRYCVSDSVADNFTKAITDYMLERGVLVPEDETAILKCTPWLLRSAFLDEAETINTIFSQLAARFGDYDGYLKDTLLQTNVTFPEQIYKFAEGWPSIEKALVAGNSTAAVAELEELSSGMAQDTELSKLMITVLKKVGFNVTTSMETAVRQFATELYTGQASNYITGIDTLFSSLNSDIKVGNDLGIAMKDALLKTGVKIPKEIIPALENIQSLYESLTRKDMYVVFTTARQILETYDEVFNTPQIQLFINLYKLELTLMNVTSLTLPNEAYQYMENIYRLTVNITGITEEEVKATLIKAFPDIESSLRILFKLNPNEIFSLALKLLDWMSNSNRTVTALANDISSAVELFLDRSDISLQHILPKLLAPRSCVHKMCRQDLCNVPGMVHSEVTTPPPIVATATSERRTVPHSAHPVTETAATRRSRAAHFKVTSSATSVATGSTELSSNSSANLPMYFRSTTAAFNRTNNVTTAAGGNGGNVPGIKSFLWLTTSALCIFYIGLL